MASLVEQLDAQIAAVLSEWSLITTVLAVAIVALVVHPLLFPEEPDTHPLLLARQASAGAIRNRGESAAYRSPEVPHGYPLKSGLNVRDEGAPKWATGKDGDLRDIWREVMRSGSTGADGKAIPKGAIMSVLGKEEVIEHDIADLTMQIATIGSHLQAKGVKKVALYLPNSIEYLLALFACAFHGVTPVLLPYNQPHPKAYKILNQTGVDATICAAGTLPPKDLAKACTSLQHILWVVEKSSRQMDWSETPEGVQKHLSVAVWHELVEEGKSADLVSKDGPTPGEIVVVWRTLVPKEKLEVISFSQQNFTSATAALVSAIPLRQRLTAADLVLPADTFAHTYVLCLTLGALFTHASVAITSVASPGVDFALAQRGVSPTVVIASPETLAALHAQQAAMATSFTQKLGRHSHTQTLVAGRMPGGGLLSKLASPPTAPTTTPAKLRLVLVSERLGAKSTPLTSAMLSDLRVYLRSRIVYALTAGPVAGAISQSNVFDYRREEGTEHAHFGIPLSSVEVKLINGNDAEVATTQPKGELFVSGPAVAGGSVNLGIYGRIRPDSTIAYV